MQVVLIDEARNRGLKRYFTGRPCPHGHVAERFVSTRACSVCQKARLDEWRAESGEHLRQYAKGHYRKNSARYGERARAYRARDPEGTKQRKAAEYQRNKHRYNARAKRYREANKERLAEAERRKIAENPEQYRAYKRNYKARKRLASGSHTAEDIFAIFKAQRGRCGYCRHKLGKRYHVDHIIALFNGGSNDRSNLQILCGSCNNAKRAKDPIIFARSKGLLI